MFELDDDAINSPHALEERMTNEPICPVGIVAKMTPILARKSIRLGMAARFSAE